jgi:uncharacterized membrane protein (DUF485 family)
LIEKLAQIMNGLQAKGLDVEKLMAPLRRNLKKPNMADQSTPHSLKELVVKLNDRNIQRQRESGLTIYAIIAAIIYIIFELVKSTPKFIGAPRQTDNLVILTIVGDAAFALGYFLIFIFGKTSTGFTKIFPKQNFMSYDSSFTPYLLFFGAVAFLNFQSFINSSSNSLIYFFFGSLMSLNFILPIIIQLVQWFKRGKPRVPEFTYLNSKRESFAKKVSVFYGTLLSVIVTVLVFKEQVNMSHLDIGNTVLFGTQLVGLFFGVAILIDLSSKRNYNDRLEELEKEIFLKNLSNDQIKSMLEEDYFGQDFKGWANSKMSAISEYFSSLTSKLNKQAVDLEALVNSLGAKSEAAKLINNNVNSRALLVNELIDYDKDFKKQIKLLKTYSSIENDEVVTLVDLQNHYNRELERLGNVDQSWRDQYERIPKVSF